MKRTLIFAALAVSASMMWARMPEANDVTITDFSAAREDSKLNLSFNLDLSKLPKGINNETRLIPVVKGEKDSVRLESVTVAGRNRMIQAERTGAVKANDNKYYRLGEVKRIPYQASLVWRPWMEKANIDLIVENVGCCESRKTAALHPMARIDMGERPMDMELEYATPVEERIKIRNIRGEAFIDFVVNTTNIRPEYRKNPTELAKIRASIDSVKGDPDVKIKSLTITGYASPEGSYESNERLAMGRTEALANYVQNLYTFPRNMMHTSWTAEDWAGLRRFVENSTLAKRDAILAVIDSDLAPDTKDRKLATDFPTDYKYMLNNWYPALRHSDYTVEFEVRQYSDPEEIARVFRTNPNKLSLRELFIYAETLDPKSSEYAHVFETAARLYPLDETANLNAGNCAMSSGNFDAAKRYLAKAGYSAQAIYARGVLAAKTGNYDQARKLFNEAGNKGIDASLIKKALQMVDRANDPEIVVFD